MSSTLDSEGFFTLNTGAKIPAVGLGTWQADGGEGKAAVTAALAAGYRHIDCAHLYGNEVEVGLALAEAFAGGVPGLQREDVFVTSKLWCTTNAPKRVQQACERSLKKLGLSYLDLFLLHWPVVAPMGDLSDPPSRRRQTAAPVDGQHIAQTWEAMEALVSQGLAKAIGLSNFSAAQIADLLEHANIPPAVNQVELHPYWRQDELLAYCQHAGIHVSAHTPLGVAAPKELGASGSFPSSEANSPRRGSSRSGRSSPLSPSSSENLGSALSNLRSRSVHRPLIKESAIARVAEQLGKTPSQVILRWGLQRGTSVLPRSVRPDRIKSNYEVLSWSLSEEDFAAVNSLEPQVRLIDGAHAYLSEYGPFRTIDEADDDLFSESDVDDTGSSKLPARAPRDGALEEVQEDPSN